MRVHDVAALAGVTEGDVIKVNTFIVRRDLSGKMSAVVLETATMVAGVDYYKVGDNYYLDDPFFGPVVSFADLAYDPKRGLYDKRSKHGE